MSGAASQEDLAITLGVEEEFFLVDPGSRDLLADPDPAIFDTCEKTAGPHKVVREFLRSQIETNTRVCGSVAELSQALRETRRIVIEAAERHGATVMAASTHPLASWTEQAPTPQERYARFAVTFQDNVRRFLICGMHIHARLRQRRFTHSDHDSDPPLSAVAPCAVHIVAVQRWARDGVQVLAADPRRRSPAHRNAGSSAVASGI